MMKNLIATIISIVFTTVTNSQNSIDKIKGEWTGDFGKKKITIVIEKVERETIYGYNIVGSNKREINGIYELKGDTIYAELNEPGDNKYDGVFKITFKTNGKAEGTWNMFKGKKLFRNFTLKKVNANDKPSNKALKSDLTKRNTTKDNSELKQELINSWEGVLRLKDDSVDFAFDILRVKQDSVFGIAFVLNKENRIKEFDYKGKISYDSAVPFVEGIVYFTKTTGAYLDFNYDSAKQRIAGTYTTNSGKFTVDLKKSKRIKQPKAKVKVLDTRISTLENHIKELSGLYDEVLYYGRATPYTTVKKTKDKLRFIDNWTKENPIPADSNLLTFDQQRRMRVIKEFLIFSSTNTKLVNILNR